jgi:hypothetical protein
VDWSGSGGTKRSGIIADQVQQATYPSTVARASAQSGYDRRMSTGPTPSRRRRMPFSVRDRVAPDSLERRSRATETRVSRRRASISAGPPAHAVSRRAQMILSRAAGPVAAAPSGSPTRRAAGDSPSLGGSRSRIQRTRAANSSKAGRDLRSVRRNRRLTRIISPATTVPAAHHARTASTDGPPHPAPDNSDATADVHSSRTTVPSPTRNTRGAIDFASRPSRIGAHQVRSGWQGLPSFAGPAARARLNLTPGVFRGDPAGAVPIIPFQAADAR